MNGHVPSENQPDEPARLGEVLRRLVNDYGDRVSLDEPLSRWTTFRIGGPARAVCRLQTPDDARRFLDNARDHEIPVVVLAGGSNVLADDDGFAGLVLHPELTALELRGDAVTVGAGLPVDDLVAATLRAGLTGLEFASGLPGTVGGALVGNAGCYGHELGEFLVEAEVLRADGRLEIVGPEAFGFAYRNSIFKGRDDLLLSAVFRLRRGDAATAGERRAEIIGDRRSKHPVGLPCAGSWFRNLPPEKPGGRRRATGRLLDELGARDWREGDAGVFEKHANIIINLGAARSADVLRLSERMKAAAAERFGVTLTPEVRHLGRSGW